MTVPRLRPSLIGLLLCCLPALASAVSYRVDLIVYLDQNYQRGGPGEPQTPATVPALGDAIDIDDAIRLEAAGVRLLPESDFLLEQAWQRLNNSRRFQPLAKLAWIQQDPPSVNGPKIRLRQGSPQMPDGAMPAPALNSESPAAFYTLDGTVTLLLSRYLHVDVDLQYAQPQDNGRIGYRLTESRRMRSNELHHLDSPRFGVLVQATRADSAGAE